jgi:hypothetical protein
MSCDGCFDCGKGLVTLYGTTEWGALWYQNRAFDPLTLLESTRDRAPWLIGRLLQALAAWPVTAL